MIKRFTTKPFTTADPQISPEGLHVWPFPPAFPVDVAEFAFEQHCDFRMNRHDYFEMMYVLSGEAEIQVERRRLSLRTGDLFVIGAGLYHSLITAPNTRLEVLGLFFLPEVVRATCLGGDDVVYLTPFLVQDSKFPHTVPSTSHVPGKVAELMRHVQQDLPADTPRARLNAVTSLKMALTFLGAYYSARNITSEAFDQRERDLRRIAPVFQHLEHHYGETLHVADAARLCAMSASHFMSYFKRVTGQSFLAYVNHFRIAKAHALLASSEMTISEIALELGFCDQSHFGETFRKVVGMSPRAYRRSAVSGRSAISFQRSAISDQLSELSDRLSATPTWLIADR